MDYQILHINSAEDKQQFTILTVNTVLPVPKSHRVIWNQKTNSSKSNSSD